MDIVYTLGWWLGFLYLGWVTFILLRPTLSVLHDHGYAVAKAVGLVGFTYVLWLLGSAHILPFGWGSALLVALIGGAVVGWQLFRRPQLRRGWPVKNIIVEEIVFALSLGGWAAVRSWNPRIEGVEKLMDVAILNGLLRSKFFPPEDVWFSGHTINYYYFGHMMVAAMSKLTHVPAQIAFNLGLAGVFALCIILTVSLVYQLTRWSLAAGVSAFLLTLSSNLDPAIASFKHTKDYIFFAATRLDPYTINEFPLYSFVVADLHAHTLGLPVALGIITLLYVALDSETLSWPLLGSLGLMLGATGPTNSFDLIMYGALTAMVFQLRAYRRANHTFGQWKPALGYGGGIGLVGVALFSPFYLSFHPGVGGIGVQLFKTPLSFIGINFGILFLFCLPILPMSLPPLRFLHRIGFDKKKLPLREMQLVDWFAVLLVVFGLLLIVAPEFMYLKDIYSFQNPPYARANTIFKVYYQAWVVLSLAAGYGLFLARSIKLRWRLNDLYILAAGAAIGLSLMGTWSAVKAYRDSKPTTQPVWTLDGYSYLAEELPDQLAMIHFINTSIPGQARILEAAGESYTQRSRVSAYTGLPTPLGWASHEWGWRYSPDEWPVIAGKEGEIEQIYKTTDVTQLRDELAKLGIKYVVFSDVERQQYSIQDFPAIRELAGDPIFQQGNFALYQVP